MKNTAFMATMVMVGQVFMTEYSPLHGLQTEYPFEFEKIAGNFCMIEVRHDNYTASVGYDFKMKIEDGMFSKCIRGFDDFLNLDIRLEFKDEEEDGDVPYNCSVTDQQRRPYFSQETWVVPGKDKRKIYIVSFEGSNTILIIRHVKKNEWRGSWGLRSIKKFLDKEFYEHFESDKASLDTSVYQVT